MITRKRRLSLGGLLIGVHVAVVLVAVACVLTAAVSRLRQLTDEQALARVALAGANAVQAISRSGDEVLIAARLLAERPTLARLVERKDVGGLTSFLERFRTTSHLAACAVSIEGSVFASSGPPVPWEAIGGDRAGPGDRFFLQDLGGGPLIIGAWSAVRSIPGATVTAALLLDESFAAGITAQVGLPVTILDRHEALRYADDPKARARARAVTGAAPVSRLIKNEALYVSVVPLRGAAGEVMGVVETGLAAAGLAGPLREMVNSLLVLAAVVGAAGAVLSIFFARWLVQPLEALAGAAARIGGGDLATPVPRSAGAEMSTLSASMEEMRNRLLHLTVELRLKQAEAEAILTGIAEGVYAVDRERRILYMNPQAATLLGVDVREAIGRFCGDVLNAQGPAGTRPCEEICPIIHARFGGRARATERLLMPDGEQRTVVITSAFADPGGSRMRDASAEEGRQFQVMRDETEMEATRRLRDVVLANISHEFRTPLTAQLASIELLRDRLAGIGAPEAQMLVQSLERGTLRLTQLIDNLLESVRIEAGQHSIRNGTVALDEVIEEAVEMTKPLIAQRGQSFNVDLPYPLPPVRGDAPRLTQVFVNLLANANKFAPAGSSITIGGEVGDSVVTLWVEDEGPGVRLGSGSDLFERFVRSTEADEDPEPEQGGMGLGLAIVKSIMERHGGRVEARSAGSHSRGARMCVSFPLEPADESARR